MALFAFPYAALASEWGAWSWWDALHLSVRHGLVVGGLVRTGHMQQVIEAMFGGKGSGLALLMMGQTLVSAFFCFSSSSPCATTYGFGRRRRSLLLALHRHSRESGNPLKIKLLNGSPLSRG